MALLAANILFGANFSLYVSLTQHGVSFQQIFILQLTVAALFFAPSVLFSRQSYRIALEDFGSIFIVAIMVVYGWMYMLLWGATETSPIDASMIATLGPVVTLFVAHIVHPQPISWIKAIGALLAIAGTIALLSDKNYHLLGTTNEAFGNALVLFAVIAIAANTVLINSQLRQYGVLTIVGWYYVIGLIMAAPFFYRDFLGIFSLSISKIAIFELVYVTLFGTVLPMYLLYVGSRHLTAVHTALYRYVQPLVATTLALLRGQTVIDHANIVGAVLIFSGVVFVVTGNIFPLRRG
ncbi:MAG: DMT family transporter [Alistipes sp.]|nr:DMT family transporter [Alistipes sp.]